MIQERINIPSDRGPFPGIFLRPEQQNGPVPALLWIHGGGYVLGMAEMVNFTCGRMLAEKFNIAVLSPEYRLASEAPYPAALEDCYAALVYMHEQAAELGIDPEKIFVGGESAGGGLAAAVCIYARDQGRIPVAGQLPLYPMLDCEDTASSRDNHGRVWNTKRNHWGWSKYLGDLYQSDHVPPYASAARETSYRDLPKCYTFVSDGEPFYEETLAYVRNLRLAGVPAQADVYHGNIHAFDMLCLWLFRSRIAKEKLCRVFGSWLQE
ncbi:MAG: alpha/beta hydrolase [Solobacterium sp.]|nr:alpha/beta hydrolase [Solobacterium sp.]